MSEEPTIAQWLDSGGGDGDRPSVPPYEFMGQFLWTREEIDAVAVAIARSVDPDTTATDAHTAAATIWAMSQDRVLCSVATNLAEESYGLDRISS